MTSMYDNLSGWTGTPLESIERELELSDMIVSHFNNENIRLSYLLKIKDKKIEKLDKKIEKLEMKLRTIKAAL